MAVVGRLGALLLLAGVVAGLWLVLQDPGGHGSGAARPDAAATWPGWRTPRGPFVVEGRISDPVLEEVWAGLRNVSGALGGGGSWEARYLEWLQEALAGSPEGFYRVLDETYYLRAPPLQPEVALARIPLPHGAEIVVTAYPRTGTAPSPYTIVAVVHARIVNTTEWRRLLSKIAVFEPPFLRPEWAVVRMRAWHLGWLLAENVEMEEKWVLWRFSLPGRTHVETPAGRIPVSMVYVLLEMPVYVATPDSYKKINRFTHIASTIPEWDGAERAYWALVARPAMSLAVRLAYGSDNPAELYREVIPYITKRLVVQPSKYDYGRHYPRTRAIPDSFHVTSPVMLRVHGGRCADFARAAMDVASVGLGGVTAYMRTGTYAHAIAVLVYPSTAFGADAGPVRFPFDIDGDGVNETGSVLADTAKLSLDLINSDLKERAVDGFIVAGVGYGFAPHTLYRVDAYDVVLPQIARFAGIVDEATSMPAYLQPPWENITRRFYNISPIRFWCNDLPFTPEYARDDALATGAEVLACTDTLFVAGGWSNFTAWAYTTSITGIPRPLNDYNSRVPLYVLGAPMDPTLEDMVRVYRGEAMGPEVLPVEKWQELFHEWLWSRAVTDTRPSPVSPT